MSWAEVGWLFFIDERGVSMVNRSFLVFFGLIFAGIILSFDVKAESLTHVYTSTGVPDLRLKWLNDASASSLPYNTIFAGDAGRVS